MSFLPGTANLVEEVDSKRVAILCWYISNVMAQRGYWWYYAMAELSLDIYEAWINSVSRIRTTRFYLIRTMNSPS